MSKPLIYHICEDEKFINSAIKQFEDVYSGYNKFYVLVKDITQEFRYINTQSFVTKVDSNSVLNIIDQITSKDIVVFHSLSKDFYDFCLQLPQSIQTVWMCFGFEIYNDHNYTKDAPILAPITLKKFIRKSPSTNYSLKKRVKNALRPIYHALKGNRELSFIKKKEKSIQRIDYLATSFKQEHHSICKFIQQEKKNFKFWYYPLHLIVDVNAKIESNKTAILIGNSGFRTGNHLDVFNALKQLPITQSKIYVPLSYGNPNYIQAIKEEGQLIFKDKFNPLLTFLPLKDYNQILNTIGIAIFYNFRQQAVGNTIAILWYGAKVFLSEKNPFYHYLKDLGIIVFSVEKDLNAQSISSHLDINQIENNRKILYDQLNQNQLKRDLENQIHSILNLNK